MRTAVRSACCGAVLAAVLGAGWAAGTAVRPTFPGTAPPVAAAPAPQAWTLTPRTTELDPGRPGEYAFTLTGPPGAVPAAAPRLVVVRRDGADLQVLTPVAGADGVWRAPLTLPSAGGYRVLAEVAPAVTLGADLLAPGDPTPERFAPSRVAEVDGYQIRLDGDLVPGASAQVFATVSRDGAPVTDLEPVDGAFGRLAGVRQGDLALLHVHPDAAPPAPTDRGGPGIAFIADVPAAGTYRLFLEFRHGGAGRRAAFTVSAPEAGAPKEAGP